MIGEMEWDMDSIAVLSIGTGSAIRDLRKETLREGQWGWGMLEWILPNKGNIINTFQDGGSEASQAIVEVLFAVRLLLCCIPGQDQVASHPPTELMGMASCIQVG